MATVRVADDLVVQGGAEGDLGGFGTDVDADDDGGGIGGGGRHWLGWEEIRREKMSGRTERSRRENQHVYVRIST